MNSLHRFCCILLTILVAAKPGQAQFTPDPDVYTNSTFDALSIDLSKPVGAIESSAGTTPSGGATYNIPIKCPPGTGGMVPTISVGYNSQSGNGLLGMGWNISGLSAISRSGKDLYHDGVVSATTYTNNDPFVMDGSRLVLSSGTNGGDGATYRTEAESFSAVTSLGTAGTGPQWFKVILKNGTVMEYGNTSDSRIMTDDNSAAMLWRLNKVTDANGNYMTFTYVNTDRDSRISQITYTGHDGTGGFAPTTGYNTINFTYVARAIDPKKVYDKGYTLQSKYLLQQVQILGESEVFKTYKFNYGTNGISTYLKYVEEFASDSSKLNETRFKYGSIVTNTDIQSTNIPAMGLVNAQMGLFTGDFNGDGLADLVRAQNFLGLTGTTLERYSNFHVFTRDNATSDNYTHAFGVPKLANGVFQDPRTYTNSGFVPSDFNGDGRDDILLYKLGADDDKFHGTTIYYAGTSTPLSFAETTYAAPTGGNFFKTNNVFFTGDFDGDKRTDYICNLVEATTTPVFFSFISTPATGDINKSLVNPATGIADIYFAKRFALAEKMLVIDYDGDGRSELMLQHDAYFYVYGLDRLSSGNYAVRPVDSGAYPSMKYQHVLGVGDFNGDGKTDFLTRDKTSPFALKVGYGTGKGYAQSNFAFNRGYDETCKWDPGPGPVTANGDDIYIADFNGDGLSDIFQVKKSCNSIEYDTRTFFDVYYSQGSSFKYESTEYAGAVGEPYAPTLGDMNGDGKVDFNFVRKEALPAMVRTLYFKKNSTERLLEKVKDGMNRVSEFVYATLPQTTGSSYTKGTGATYPVNNLQSAMYVVTATKAPDGTGGISQVNYGYEDLRFHRRGRGLLGFTKVIATQPVLNSRTESRYELNNTYYVPYLKQTKTFLAASGTPLSNLEYTYSFSAAAGTYGYEQKTIDIVTQDYLAGASTVTHKDYDSWGNVTHSETNIHSGLEITTTNTTYIIPASATIPSLPSSSTTTRQRSGKPPVSKTTTFTYSGRLPANVTEFSGMPHALSKVMTYDRYGNILTEQTQQAAVSSSLWPKTEYTYDPKGRFPIAAKNPLGQFSYSSYHKFWGQAVSVTSVSGLVTTYEYNAWGKLIQANMPGPYSITYSEGWDVSGLKRYYTLSQHPGAPDVKTWYDILGRPLQVNTETFGSDWTSSYTTYDARGNVASATNSYKSGETPELTTNTYDDYNRPSTAASSAGTTTYNYSFDAGKSTITVTDPASQSTSKTTDAAGRTISSTDNGGTMIFSFDSWGNQLDAKNIAKSATLIINQYDAYGRRVSMTDINAGTSTYTYNSLHQLKEEKDGYGNRYEFKYDIIGRVTERIPLTGSYSPSIYTYFGATKENKLRQVVIGLTTQSYDYDAMGRISEEKLQTPGKVMIRNYGYDIYSRNTTIGYSSGLQLLRSYDANGFLQLVRTNTPGTPAITLFNAFDMNGQGQYTAYQRCNSLLSEHSYQHGLPVRYITPGIQDLQMDYDFSNGNLLLRRDHITGYQEAFNYDNQERLTSAAVSKFTAPSMSYPAQIQEYDVTGSASLGNISNKSDAGQYWYSPISKINAVQKVMPPLGAISHNTQEITYTTFGKTGLIKENGYEQSFAYDGNDERYFSQLKNGSTIERNRWYFGGYEIDQAIPGPERHIHYISGGDGLCAIVVKEGSTYTAYAAYTDHLGSLVKLTNQVGTTIATQNFDAWGRERNPLTWDYSLPFVATKPDWLYRGYTGHEMLPKFDLINMNGRMYDPVNARMLRPDDYIQDPLNTQNYNGYSYCWNNPLKYTDPTGDFIWILPSIGVSNGGVDIGVSVVVGLPGGLSAQAGISHNLGSGSTYGYIGASAGMFTASVGWGTQTGFTASAGLGLGFGPGFNSNLFGAGVSWSETGGFGASAAGFHLSSRGFSFDPNLSYTFAIMYRKELFPGSGEFEGDGTEDLPFLLKPVSVKSASYWNYGAWITGGQTVLDIAGLIPGIGEIADGINALIYVAQGDYTNAGLSVAAMVPFAGWAATGGKLAGKAAKTINKTSGWVKRSAFKTLDPAIQKKVAAAIEKGIVSPTGKQGIIKLTATEAAQTGYQYKVKILGKGGDTRIYGNALENGHILFDKIMGH